MILRPLWWEEAAPASPAPSLPASVDVAIVGGGFTGLWTALYLLRARPDLSVLVLEAEHVGFGASGRNGGWVSALFPVSADALAARHGRDAAQRMVDALVATVDEVGAVAEDEGVDAGFVKGGTLVVARGEAQAAGAADEVLADEAWGGATTWLGREELLERFAVADAPGRPVLGATVNPHCARVHPRRLVDGLARAVRRRGGIVAEGCPVADVPSTTAAPQVTLVGGEVVRSRTVVRATEAWTASLPRPRGAVPPRVAGRAPLRPPPAGLRATAVRAARAPARRRPGVHPCLGRAAGHPPGLAPGDRVRPGGRGGLGRRLRR